MLGDKLEQCDGGGEGYDRGGVGWGEVEGRSKREGYMYTFSWFISLYSRNFFFLKKHI